MCVKEIDGWLVVGLLELLMSWHQWGTQAKARPDGVCQRRSCFVVYGLTHWSMIGWFVVSAGITGTKIKPADPSLFSRKEKGDHGRSNNHYCCFVRIVAVPEAQMLQMHDVGLLSERSRCPHTTAILLLFDFVCDLAWCSIFFALSLQWVYEGTLVTFTINLFPFFWLFLTTE